MVMKVRKFYIFNVNKEMSILTKDSPYMLFKSFESIYRSDRADFDIAYSLYGQLASKFNKGEVSKKISEKNLGSQHYIGSLNHHTYTNKYRGEKCELEIKNSYLLCESTGGNLYLLNGLKGYNLFACDFENKDYFWLDEICC